MRKTIVLGIALLIGVGGIPYTNDDVQAKGFSSSRSFSSSSSFSRSSIRSSSSSSSSKGGFWSSKSTTTSTPTKSNKEGFTSNKGQSTKTGGGNGKSMADAGKAARTKQAMTVHKQQTKFKEAPRAPGLKVSGTGGSAVANRAESRKYYNDTYRNNGVYNRARSYDPGTYYDRRTRYYGGYEPPVYVYNNPSSFGVWDTIFLYHIMNDNNHSGQFAYNHQNDPDYQAWREQANILAKDNAELRKQLADMDAGAAKLAGTPINPSYLPEGVDADVALSSGAREASLPTFKVCVGYASGTYYKATAGTIAPALDLVNTVVVTTQGSAQEIEMLANGECDAAFVQADAYWNYVEDHQTTKLPFSRLMTPYRETVHLLCREDGPSELSELTAENKVWFPKGSGAAVTWRNFIGENEDYAKVQTPLTNDAMNPTDYQASAFEVAMDPKSCMMYVGGASNDVIRTLDTGSKASKLVLVDIDDGKLDNTEDPSGEDVYEFTQIDSSEYTNLTRQNGVLWGSGDVDVLTVGADFIVSTNWQEKHKNIYPSIAMSILNLQDRVSAVSKAR